MERFSLQFCVDTYNTFDHRSFSIGLPTNNGTLDQTTNPNPLAASYAHVDAGPDSFLNRPSVQRRKPHHAARLKVDLVTRVTQYNHL
jgi:hypothetical protein